MALIRAISLAVLLCGSLFATAQTALILNVEGNVTVGPPVRRVLQRQRLTNGQTLHLPQDSKVTLLCSTERRIDLAGPQDWLLERATCDRGRAVPAGSYADVSLDRIRSRTVKDQVTFEWETRGDVGTALIPIVVSPRNSTIDDPRPTLTWTSVENAREYEIEWLREQTVEPTLVAAADARCGKGSGFWAGLQICTLPFPAHAPALEAGTSVFVMVGARMKLAGALQGEKDPVRVRVLGAKEHDLLTTQLNELKQLPADPVSRSLLVSGAYATNKMYGEAMETLQELLAINDLPEARVRLGDLALTVRLPAIARREYQRVTAMKPEDGIRAAAELGLGRVAYGAQQFAEARGRFQSAAAIYRQLGLEDAEKEARAAAARAKERVRQ